MTLAPDFLSLKAPWREKLHLLLQSESKKSAKGKGRRHFMWCVVLGTNTKRKKKKYSSYRKQVYGMVIRADDGRTSKKTEPPRMPAVS